MARRPIPRHFGLYAHHCAVTGRVVGLERAIRWSPVAKRPARHRPPVCPLCGAALALEAVAYQPAAHDTWDTDLERSRLIFEALSERELN